MSRAIGPIPISFKSLPLLKKHEADAAKLKSTHYIVCHGGDEDRHHAEHDRSTDPREQVEKKHGAAHQFTKGDDERNGGDEQ